MSWRSVLSAVFRISLVLAVALSGMTFGVDDAEARRGGKFRSSKSRAADDHTTKKQKSDEEHDAHGADDSSGGSYVPRTRVRSREAARGSSETTTDSDGLPSKRRLPPVYAARAMSVRPIQDLDVPGCPTGMICTVCLAGCEGEIGGIVDAQVKTPAPLVER